MFDAPVVRGGAPPTSIRWASMTDQTALDDAPAPVGNGQGRPTTPDPRERDRRASSAWRPGGSLARRFLLANVAIYLIVGLAAGAWLGGLLERGIVQQTATVTGLYVNSFTAPLLAPLASNGQLPPSTMTALDELVERPAFAQEVAELIVWSPEGTVAYHPDPSLVSERLEPGEGFAAALGGEIVAGWSDASQQEVLPGLTPRDRLLEIYVPIRDPESGRIVAVAETYKVPDALDREVGEARLTAWAVIALAITVSAAVLYGLVKRGSDRIVRQDEALAQQVTELSGLLHENEMLNERVRLAAERSTTVNERAMRRISSDLHDGPGQSLSLALLRIDGLRQDRAEVAEDEAVELAAIEAAMQEAMKDMRAIAAGLRLPELSGMSAAEVAQRAVDGHVKRSGTKVDLRVASLPEDVPLSVRVSLYRAITELLSNATRHAEGASIRATVESRGPLLCLQVRDDGPGFDPRGLSESPRLGLAGTREQAELLGGRFEVRSALGEGTTVDVCWRLHGNHPEEGEMLT